MSILDYKCTSVWSVIFGKSSWEQQLNFYAWLVQECKGLKVSKLQILAVLRDWKQSEADFKSDYPKQPIMTIDIPLWETSQQEEFVRQRVQLHQQAEFDYLNGDPIAECTADETWMRATKFAVMKKGRKRAIKLHDDEADAMSHAESLDKTHYVEKRRETEIISQDKAIMGKTIGIVRGLKGRINLQIKFSAEAVTFMLGEGQFSMDNALFNSLDTNEIVKIIEGHIDGGK